MGGVRLAGILDFGTGEDREGGGNGDTKQSFGLLELELLLPCLW